jgi:DNA-binding MarR family transcriptional regulator
MILPISRLMASKKHSNAPADEKPQALDAPVRRRLPPLLRRAWYGLNQAFRRRIAHTGATPDQFTAMRSLLEVHEAGITQRQLTEMMSSDPNTIASLLERMEKTGWIERREHERDKRAYRICLKPAGKRKYEELRAIALELQSKILEALPENRREQFLEDLAGVADACRDAAQNLPGRGK